MSHLSSEERESIGQSVKAETYWAWTEKTQRIYPDRKAGTPVHEHHRQSAPALWVLKGYVKEGGR